MPDNYDLKTFQNESIESCADGNCGRSVVTNANDNDGDCCIPGPQGPEGPAGKTGPAGPTGSAGPAGRPPVIRCGCLPVNEPPAPPEGGGGAIDLSCLDSMQGRVVISLSGVEYYGTTTSNTFTQVTPGETGFIWTTSPGAGTPIGTIAGSLGDSSTSTSQKNIVANGYQSNGITYRNFTWSYKDFLLLTQSTNSNYGSNNRLSVLVGSVKLTFMPTDTIFASSADINLGAWSHITRTGGDLANTQYGTVVQDFLNDFPNCGTDQGGGGGIQPPKNGQGASICSNLSSPCDCTGCDQNNRLTSCDGLQAGDMFIDACNKIMYIRGSEDWPTDGIPFDEGADCPPCPSCPECPACPECPPPDCKQCPCKCLDILPPQICNCVSQLSALVGTDCNCPGGLGPPKCPKSCSNGNGVYYQNEAKECGCATNQTYVGCVDCKTTPTIICECPEGKTAGCCETCPPAKTCAELNCCAECPTPTCESLGCPTCPPIDEFGNCGCTPFPIGGCSPTIGCCFDGTEYDICLNGISTCCVGSFSQNGALLLGE